MKKRIIILGAVVVLVVAGASAAWFYAAGLVRQEIERLALADGETSPQVTCGTLGIGGFPFAFDITCADAVIVSGDVLTEVPALRVSAMVYDLTHFLAGATGPAEISDAFTGQRSAIAWSGLEASLRLTGNRIARLSVVADDLAWNDLLVGDTTLATSPHAELHLLDIPEMHDADRHLAALALYAKVDGLSAPSMAIADSAVELEAELTALPDDLTMLGATPFLPAWQQNGGTLNLVSLRATGPDADLTASGTMALDPAGYPTGSIAIDSQGVAERIGPLIEEPWRTLVLGVPGDDGRYANQLNFNAGTISSGLIPITAVPPLF